MIFNENKRTREGNFFLKKINFMLCIRRTKENKVVIYNNPP